MKLYILQMNAIGLGIVLLVSIQRANADYIGATAVAKADANGPNANTSVKSQGPLTAQATWGDNGSTTGTGNDYVSLANTLARVNATGYPVVTLGGYADSTVAGFSPYGAAIATSDSTWDDIISLRPRTAGIATTHPTLYLKVAVSASINLGVAAGAGNDSYSNEGTLNLKENIWNYNTGSVVRNVYYDNLLDSHYRGTAYQNGFETSYNWDNLSVQNGILHGEATFAINYSSIVQGYNYELEYIIRSSAYLGMADIVSDHTLDLVGVTFADGTTPESHGFDVLSASGIQSPNVAGPGPEAPEPPGLGLLGIGALGLLGYRWCRRSPPSVGRR